MATRNDKSNRSSKGRPLKLKVRTHIDMVENGFTITLPKKLYAEFIDDKLLMRFGDDYELYKGNIGLKNAIDEEMFFYPLNDFVKNTNTFAFLTEPIRVETDGGLFVNRQEIKENSPWNIIPERLDADKFKIYFERKS